MGRAVLFHGADQPFELASASNLEPGEGEILVRVTCCTLCRSDLTTQAGRRTEPTPLILGHEIVGRIEAFGPGTSHHDARELPTRVGDRITWAVAAGCGHCFFCIHDLPQKCERLYKYGHVRTDRDRPSGGGLADRIVLVAGTTWLRIPDDLPDHVVAPANCATATVAGLFRQAGEIRDRTVLILGSGMLGLTASAMARASGARNIVVSDPSTDSRSRAGSFGAAHLVSADRMELKSLLADLTEGRGADLVLELAGVAPSVANALALARIGGTVLLAGAVAPIASVLLDAEFVVRRMLTIRGIHNYHPHDLARALDFLDGPGRAFPFASLVSMSFALEDIESAFAYAHANPGTRVAIEPERRGLPHGG